MRRPGRAVEDSVNGGSGSLMLLHRRPFFDRLYLRLDRVAESPENIRKHPRLVKAVLAPPCGRQVEIKVDLVKTICDPERDIATVAILFAARRDTGSCPRRKR